MMAEDVSSSTTAGGSCMSRQRPSSQSSATGTSATFSQNRQKSSDSIVSNDDKNDNDCFLFSEHILGGLPVMKRLFSAERNIFMALVAFRVVNALLIQTQYVPDEYWQSLEIAHSTAFGYGYQTWEWRNALRGYLYPSIFTVLYKVLQILRLDYRILLIKAPRMLQGVLAATAIGSCLTLSTLVDYLGYGKFVLVQYNFFKFNVLSNLGSHYGTHPWHWYVTQGYPVIIATHLVPFVAGVCKARNKSLFTVILWTLLIYSFLSHKEFRFVMHTIPLSMHYCGVYFHSLCTEDLQSNTKPHSSEKGHSVPSPENSSGNASPDSEQKKKYFVQKSRLTKAYYLLIFLAVTNIPLAFYFNLIHQRGTVLVTKFLHDEFAPEKLTPTSHVLFLMPCHSTPFYSHIHRRVPMRFLTCEPNLSQTDPYVDEADLFFNDPLKWLDKEYNMTTSKKTDNFPTHFVYYANLHRTLFPHLDRAGYRKCGQFFHTHFPEGRCSTHVLVSCKRRTQQL
ncbi:GPI mannosyltransferase 3-like [Octopus vulgaris]|uniref:Mannosyltransferase n=1 Tax=Octopus vulgaris TaxID=6645 RepID=A0AA36BZ31_OCTVU|nr:GPI mannosyltransferase 3-like [Octopus vulgaris]